MLLKGLATPLLRDSGSVLEVPPGRLLTVREAARLLRVSTATVYKLCARGELAHVRVLNVIRIPERVLGLMARRPRAPASSRARG
jgi:excisionase family DNA binding protein